MSDRVASSSGTGHDAARHAPMKKRVRHEWVVFVATNGEWYQADAFRARSRELGNTEVAEWRDAYPHHSYALVKRTITEVATDA